MSIFDFYSFRVNFPNHFEKYDGVGAGETSAYKRPDKANRYAYTEAFAGIRSFVLQPNGFVRDRYLATEVYINEYFAQAHKKMRVGEGWFLRGEMVVMLKDDKDGI